MNRLCAIVIVAASAGFLGGCNKHHTTTSTTTRDSDAYQTSATTSTSQTRYTDAYSGFYSRGADPYQQWYQPSRPQGRDDAWYRSASPTRPYSETTFTTTTTTDSGYRSTPAATTGAATGAAAASSTTSGSVTQSLATDQRILSILHAKNQEEIRLGRLAQQYGTTDEVRRFGETAVREHTDMDYNVVATARNTGITLMDPLQVEQMLMREKGLTTKDIAAELDKLRGSEFDRAFVDRMYKGHQDLIRMVEQARPNVTDSRVRDLLDRTLPALRQHEQMAAQLMNR